MPLMKKGRYIILLTWFLTLGKKGIGQIREGFKQLSMGAQKCPGSET